MAVVTAIVVTTAATTAMSQKQARKSQRANEKAQKIDEKRQQYAMSREKRKQIRQARTAQAEVQASSFAQGTAQTSKTAGISGGVSRELGSNLSFLDSSQGFAQAIGKQNLISSQAQAKASRIQAYGGLVKGAITAGALYGEAPSNAPTGGIEGPPEPGLFG